MYVVQATQMQSPLLQNLELYLVTALQMNWHFIDIAMIMSIYLIEQLKNLITVSRYLVLQSKNRTRKKQIETQCLMTFLFVL